MALESIAVDRNLREAFSELAKQLARDGEIPLGNDVFFRHGSVSVSSNQSGGFSVERNFAGFSWRFSVDLKDLEKLINGLTREWPMERLGKSEVKQTDLSNDAITKILGSLGFEAEATANEEAKQESSATPQTAKRGHRPLTGLEDESEGKIDFGSVSESDLDAFLDAYSTATEAPKPKKAVAEMPADPLEAIVASLIAGDGSGLDSLGDLDDLEGELEDDYVDEMAIQSAQSFIDLLIKNEKLELVPNKDSKQLASRLAPMLEEDMRASKKAGIIMDWFLDQDEVEDVYLSDEEMISLVRQW
ncbi:MAG: hypothetical protein CMH52_00015 [Myxococcales bacterium]|nr:hypothetical protein [Myxococcales bacterium]|tara:strand:+ start:3419 stop:4327 length:909 start_codon:yes stop_codon:yes gene_type:complete